MRQARFHRADGFHRGKRLIHGRAQPSQNKSREIVRFQFELVIPPLQFSVKREMMTDLVRQYAATSSFQCSAVLAFSSFCMNVAL